MLVKQNKYWLLQFKTRCFKINLGYNIIIKIKMAFIMDEKLPNSENIVWCGT